MMYYIMVNGCVTRSILCVLVLVKKKTLDVQSLKADTLIVDGTHARTQVHAFKVRLKELSMGHRLCAVQPARFLHRPPKASHLAHLIHFVCTKLPITTTTRHHRRVPRVLREMPRPAAAPPSASAQATGRHRTARLLPVVPPLQ
jgi:hypothetical protein